MINLIKIKLYIWYLTLVFVSKSYLYFKIFNPYTFKIILKSTYRNTSGKI